MKKKSIILMALMLLLMFTLAGCGKKGGEGEEENEPEPTAEAQVETPTPEADKAETVPDADVQKDTGIHVTNAKELLEAIAPGAEIVLEPGDYDLTEAVEDKAFIAKLKNIELGEYGDELYVKNIDGLILRAERKGTAEVYVTDGFIDVMCFERVKNLIIENIVFGHRIEKGHCDASVIHLEYCENVALNNVEMYGCGTYGIEGYNLTGLICTKCNVHDCTYGMVDLYRASDVLFDTCVFNKNKGFTMIDGTYSSIVFDNCTLAESAEDTNLVAYDTNMTVLFKGCTFGEVETQNIKKYGYAYGNIAFDDKCKYDTDVMSVPVKETVTVRNVEQFIEAVGPGEIILVEPGEYNISKYLDKVASGEGIKSWNDRHSCVQIEEVYDGYEISFYYANGMSIVGKGDDRSDVLFVTEPRYATVLNFGSCKNMGIWNITAGHTMTGDCAGNVIDYASCEDMSLNNVDLYGCGVYGVGAEERCGDIYVYDSYIHDCEYGPFDIWAFDGYLSVFNSELTGSRGGGNYCADGGYYFYHCTFGEKESNGMFFNDYMSFDDCEFSEITEYPDYMDYEEGYPDYEDESFDYVFEEENLKQLPFDESAIEDTGWYCAKKIAVEGNEVVYYGFGATRDILTIYDKETARLTDVNGNVTAFKYYCDTSKSAVFQTEDKSKSYTFTLYVDTETNLTWGCLLTEKYKMWFYS